MIIKGLKIRYPIFIMEIKDFNIILKYFFLNLIKFSWKYLLDKIFYIIIYLYIY